MAEQDSPSTALAERASQHPVAAAGPSVPGMMSPDEIQSAYRVAAALAQSGIYKDVTSAEKAFAKLVVGRSLGLNEAQSLSLYAMEGKIEVPATMMAGWVRQRSGYDYSVRWMHQPVAAAEWAEGASPVIGCVVTITIDGDPRGESMFTLDDAEQAGLVKEKSAWKKFPRNMLFARALSNAVRWYVPEVLGGLAVYTEGEIERVPNLAEGEGNGDEPGWDDVPIAAVHEIEKLIRRAERLGHAGLASRPAAQMLLVGQSHEVIRAWIDQAKHELDALQAKQQVERGERPAPERPITVSDFAEIPGVVSVRDCDPAEGHVTLVVAEGTTLDMADLKARTPLNLEIHVEVEPSHATPEEEGIPQPEGVQGEDAPPANAPEHEGAGEPPTLGGLAEPDTSTLPHQTQLELAEAKLAGALNEREEREALVELQRLRGEG